MCCWAGALLVTSAREPGFHDTPPSTRTPCSTCGGCEGHAGGKGQLSPHPAPQLPAAAAPPHRHVQCASAPPQLHVLQTRQKEEQQQGEAGPLRGVGPGSQLEGMEQGSRCARQVDQQAWHLEPILRSAACAFDTARPARNLHATAMEDPQGKRLPESSAGRSPAGSAASPAGSQ